MYGKIFSSMFDGTLATKGPWQALVTFQQMIVLADQDGVVDMTAGAISRRTSIPLEIIEIGLSELSLPDPESRSVEEEGRRIVPLAEHRKWGWQIVNYAKFAAIRSAEERREYMRKAQAEHRARKAAKVSRTNVDCLAMSSLSTDVPVDVPVPVDVERKEVGSLAQALATPPPALLELLGDENESQIPKRALVLLSAKFDLPSLWGQDAEALGWSVGDILREAEKFRQYWVSGKGSGKRRSVKGWRQSWANWLSKAERFKP